MIISVDDIARRASQAWGKRQHGQYAVTITVDDVLFWRTYNEIHAEQVKRDGDAWMRTQGRRRP